MTAKNSTLPAETYFVCGPTASGKSELALLLAEAIGAEIINADAFQLYQGLEILTASPSLEDQKRITHHFYNCIDPQISIDAAYYRKLAFPKIHQLNSQNKPLLIVGGSGLYIKFLSHGPSPLPSHSITLQTEFESQPLTELVKQLLNLDPLVAEQVDLKNRRYVIRALEICHLSGQPVSQIQFHWKENCAEIEASLQGIYLQCETEQLNQRIQQRTAKILEMGAFQEVTNLQNPSTTCCQAIGIRQIQKYLTGEISLSQCADQMTIATRQYAKRQRTWFRREKWLTPINITYGKPLKNLTSSIIKQWNFN